jgi:hypothetical protein
LFIKQAYPGLTGKLPQRLKGTKKDFYLNTPLCLGGLVAKPFSHKMQRIHS